MRNKLWMMALLAVSPAALPASALAQNAAQNGVLVIYGNDKCPTDSDGNEIVVCSRRPESERFRIPKELREPSASPANQSWAARQQSTLDTGQGGIGSCSTIGPGGGSGCMVRSFRTNKAINREQKKTEDAIPLP